MKLTRISRGLVVAIFVLIIVFLGIVDVKLIFKNEMNNTSTYSPVIKLIYTFIIFILAIIYIYRKDKFYKMKIKRKVAIVYRYIYLVTIMIVARYLILTTTVKKLSSFNLILNIIFTIIIAIIIKRIVFNISKSDILSVIAVVAYCMNLNVIYDIETLYISTFITFILALIILVLQLLIDELKQKGIKTKKYILFSFLISVLLGIHFINWLVVLILLLFVTVNLDNTHLDFPKAFINSLSQKSKDRLYKIERININKILVSIIISIICIIIIYNLGQIVLYKLSNIHIVEILNRNLNISYNVSNLKELLYLFKDYTLSFVNLSTAYYLTIISYILLLEILSFFLRRKYDTKTTVIKSIFIMLFVTMTIFKLNILYFQPLFNVLLIIIAIINTSSIYLNREERIKMLVA